ncbi:MAG TPA: WXG100 family type VII secretion target [Acidimicrobiales bacterium]
MSKILVQPHELDGLASSFDQQGQAVDSVIRTLDSGLRIDWEGNTASAFRSDWESEFKPALHALIEALQTGGQSLRNSAGRMRDADGQH